MHVELHFTEKKKILFGIPKSLVKDKGRHGEVGGKHPWGSEGNAHFSKARYAHTHLCIHSHSARTHMCAHTIPMCAHTVHAHIPMHACAFTHARVCVQDTSREVTLSQG